MAAAGPWDNYLRFEGGRFERRGLPISVLRELQVYCELVVKVAKAVFLQNNPDHQRAPNGFDRRLSPRLVDIGEGSVRPLLERERPGSRVFDEDDEFDVATRYIGDVVAAVREDSVRSVVMDLPSFDISEFARLGKTLQPSERIVLRGSSGQEAILDAEVRRFLEGYEQQSYAARARLVGRVTGVDAAKRMFTVWLEDSRKYCRGPFEDSTYLPLLKRLLTEDRRSGPSLELDGFVHYGIGHQPSGWSELFSLEELLSDHGTPFDKLRAQLMDLRQLRGDWFDENSRAPTPDALQMATRIADGLKYRSLPSPTAFPTPDGGVSLEWITRDVQIGVMIYASGNEGQLSFWNENTGQDGLEQHDELDPDRVVKYVNRLIRS